MKKNVFEFNDYKTYLEAAISAQPKGGRGVRMALAKAMGSPVSHISQVLNGKSHLSLEQAEGVNGFFGHTQDEALFFFLLVQMGRAGTPALRSRLSKQLQHILEKRLVLKDRLGVKSLSKEDQMEFYSSWIYGAVHVMLTIPKFQTKEALSKYLGISPTRTAEILQFLLSIGLAQQNQKGRWEVGMARIHLGSDSPLISKFHSNWRIKAIQSLDKDNASEGLHYSSAISVSEADFMKIKELLVRHIEEIKQIIRDSPAEGVHSFNLDFFRI
jgi:uncharacterized protein (TIGR02147 family)